MLLTISTTHQPATDLGFLLHKHPARFQSFDLSFGKAHVFYPEVSSDRTTAAMLLDIDSVGMVRGRNRRPHSLLGQYVNDRPYVASSLLSVAIARVFGSALSGHCAQKEELAKTPIPLVARIGVLPVRAGEGFLERVFEPLGYTVEASGQVLDEKFPQWGQSDYYSVSIAGVKTLSELLNHLYVLVPVFDNQKHYYVGDDELEKLLEKGAAWLASHPEKKQITRRYLGRQPSLVRQALARLMEEEEPADVLETIGDEPEEAEREEPVDRAVSLNQQRLGAVLAALRASGARSVLDLGCGEGKLLGILLADRQFERIVGLDVSIRSLEIARRRLRLERLPDRQAQRISLIHGALTYRDRRLANFDAAALVEVIEHLDPPRLAALERVLFEFARPKTIVLTTPNREYNTVWQSLPAGEFRHADHRFEWTRREFQEWTARVADRFGYSVRFLAVGPEVAAHGPPTQMAVFQIAS
jgi:3' terminal RNA ribose 2'-O-methyltransferase Hen1